jgi:predicted ester cyclase
VDEVVGFDFIGHDPALPEPIRGIEAQKDMVMGYRRAFPDLHITIDDVLADSDKVVTRWTARY